MIMQGAVETEKKRVIKYVTKTVRLVRSALSDIKPGDVTGMSEERELFQIHGQEKAIPGEGIWAHTWMAITGRRVM